MIQRFICWWKGHDWPLNLTLKGKAQYINCRRCGEPEACTILEDGTKTWSWK